MPEVANSVELQPTGDAATNPRTNDDSDATEDGSSAKEDGTHAEENLYGGSDAKEDGSDAKEDLAHKRAEAGNVDAEDLPPSVKVDKDGRINEVKGAGEGAGSSFRQVGVLIHDGENIVENEGELPRRQPDHTSLEAKFARKPFYDPADYPEPPVKRCWDYLRRTYRDLYVEVQCLALRSSFKTKPIFNAGVDFGFEEDHENEKKFNMGEFQPSDLRLRVIIMEDEGATVKDRLIGYGQVDLIDEIGDGHVWYITVPTEMSGDPTGDVQLALRYSKLKGTEDFLNIRVMGANDVSIEIPAGACTLMEFMIAAGVLSFIALYALIMHLVEGPHAVDGGDCSGFDKYDQCLWFVTVTFSSVGYGDMYPCTDTGRVWNAILIVLSQVVLGWFFSMATRILLLNQGLWGAIIEKILNVVGFHAGYDPQFHVGDQVLAYDNRGDPKTAVILEVHGKYDDLKGGWDINYKLRWEGEPTQDKTRDFGGSPFTRFEEDLRPVDPLTQERLWKELLVQFARRFFLVMFMWIFGAVFFLYAERDVWKKNGDTLTFANTFHLAIVTMSTVGYGDWAPETRLGQTVGVFFILAGVIILADFAQTVVQYFMKRQELIHSEDFLKNSLLSPKQIVEFDVDGNGEVDKYEFLARSLIACKFVDIDKIDLIMAKFNDLDIDKSGTITMADFVMYEKLIQQRKEKVQKKEELMYDSATE